MEKKIPVKQNNECRGECVKLGTFNIKFCRKNSEDGAGEKENKAKKIIYIWEITL